jgi:hypothetical protein
MIAITIAIADGHDNPVADPPPQEEGETGEEAL